MSQVATGQPRIHLYLEANPNPNSLKFVANMMLVPEGDSYDFPDVESAQTRHWRRSYSVFRTWNAFFT